MKIELKKFIKNVLFLFIIYFLILSVKYGITIKGITLMFVATFFLNIYHDLKN